MEHTLNQFYLYFNYACATLTMSGVPLLGIRRCYTKLSINDTFLHRSPRSGLNEHPTRMWANAQPDGRPAKHRWRPLFNAAKFG